jgi:hypothetical protein
VWRLPSILAVGLGLAIGGLAIGGVSGQAWAETRAASKGWEVHESTPILRAEAPTYLLTGEECASTEAGWKIVPESVATEVVTARMMDPSGDRD